MAPRLIFHRGKYDRAGRYDAGDPACPGKGGSMGRNERAGWVSGMCVGLIFGLLCIQVSSISWFVAIAVVIAWLYVMLAYMKIGMEDAELDSLYQGCAADELERGLDHTG